MPSRSRLTGSLSPPTLRHRGLTAGRPVLTTGAEVMVKSFNAQGPRMGPVRKVQSAAITMLTDFWKIFASFNFPA
jgi:hypothetical protein